MHAMLDCETMGTAPGCAILSIGAVMFDPATGEIGNPSSMSETFRMNVDLLSSVLAGFSVEESTLDWWRDQGEDARAALQFPAPVPIRTALEHFSGWYRSNAFEAVWANGPVADVAWMEAAYRIVGLPIPWTHRDPRCYRTIVDLARLGREERAKPVVAHDAVADAFAQAADVVECYRRLGRARG